MKRRHSRRRRSNPTYSYRAASFAPSVEYAMPYDDRRSVGGFRPVQPAEVLVRTPTPGGLTGMGGLTDSIMRHPLGSIVIASAGAILVGYVWGRLAAPQPNIVVGGSPTT